MSLELTGLAMRAASSSLLDPRHWFLLVAFLLVPLSIAGTSARRTLATC